MQHLNFVNWWIRGFGYRYHEQVILVIFGVSEFNWELIKDLATLCELYTISKTSTTRFHLEHDRAATRTEKKERIYWGTVLKRKFTIGSIFYDFFFHFIQNTTEILLNQRQRYTFRVLQTFQMKLILLCVWAEPADLGSTKTALKFKYEI